MILRVQRQPDHAAWRQAADSVCLLEQDALLQSKSMNLDGLVAAQQRTRKARAKFETALEDFQELSDAHREALDAEHDWIQTLEEFVHHHGSAIHDSTVGPWLRLHLSKTLGWTADQIFELEEATRFQGNGHGDIG